MIIPSLIPILCHHFSDDIEKSFTPSAVECMRSAQIDPEIGGVITPMEAHTMEVMEGDTDFDLEGQQEDSIPEMLVENGPSSIRPDPTFLQRCLPIHDNGTISTFCKGGTDNYRVEILTWSRCFNPYSRFITPSTLSQLLNPLQDQEQ